MRTPTEILFRLRQEVFNFGLFLFPPHPRVDAEAPLPPLPDPVPAARNLQGSAFASEVRELAELILAHRFPLAGYGEISHGSRIAWRRDCRSGIESGLCYFRRLPCLDAKQVGDQKLVWELNRHQHLPVLAQAWLLSGDERYRREIEAQLEDWWRENPVQRGVNWAAALEVAFRALSWIWVFHWTGHTWDAGFRRRFLIELYRHGCHLEWNLSIYASANTHLLGEAVALHAMGRLFPGFPGAARWRRKGKDLVVEHMRQAVRDDGSYFEQSSYYHVYALDLFLFHALLEETPRSYRERLAAMARFADTLQGPGRLLPFIGDDDGGRLFHPYGPRNRFARASVAAAARYLDLDLEYTPEDSAILADWWLGPAAHRKPRTVPPRQSRWHADSGLAVMVSGSLQIIVDAGPFGRGTAGHSHSDTLSLVVRDGDRELLVDPGTYTYLAEPVWRNWFRGTSAHNTLRIGGRDQAAPANLFRWNDPPAVEMSDWSTTGQYDYLDCVCRYGCWAHRRRVVLWKDARLLAVLDEVTGETEAPIEQFWHTGEDAAPHPEGGMRIGRARLLTSSPEHTTDCERGGDAGWRSPAFGAREPSWRMRIRSSGTWPIRLATVLDFDGRESLIALSDHADGSCVRIGDRAMIFPTQGPARILDAPARSRS